MINTQWIRLGMGLVVIIVLFVVGSLFYAKTLDNKTSEDILKFIKKNELVRFNVWLVKEKTKLYSIVQTYKSNNCEGGECSRFLILDNENSQIYEENFDSVENVYSSYIMRKGIPQLVIYGKRDGMKAIKILDYQDNKIVSLTEPINFGDDFILNADIRPQFQSGVKPASEPYQILINTGIGLPSSEGKITKIFRYKNGSYSYTGEFSTTKLDNFIEKLITENQ